MNFRTLQIHIGLRIQKVRDMFSLLTEPQKRTYRFSVVWMFFSSLLEIFTLGIFVLFLKIMTAPELLTTSSWGNTLQQIAILTSSDRFIFIGCLLVALFLLKNWVTYAMFSSFNKFVYGIATTLSRTKLQEYFSLDFLDVEKRNTSEYARHIIYVPIEFSQHIVLGSMIILSETLLLVLLSISVLIFNTNAFLLIIGFFIPFVILTRFISIKKLRNVKRKIHSLNDNNSRVLSDILNGYFDAKIYRKEKYFIHRYSDMQETLNKEIVILNNINTLPVKLSEVFLICAIVVIFFLVQYGKSENTASISTTAAVFITFLYRTVPSVNKILTVWSNAHTYAATITILHPFLKSTPQNPDETVPVEYRNFQKTLELKNISFKYENRDSQILNNISMKIHKGDVIGIIGKSGSGKTTLLSLLLRLLNTNKGEVLLDGSSAVKINLSTWRTLFAFVKQSPFLLHDTIESNIAFGENPAGIDQTKLRESLTMVGLKDFIMNLPDGLQTNIGERGNQLSGGQKQRIVIARALYRNAEIFIFDEATSELDNASEKEIVDTIKALQRSGKTIIIASHHKRALIPCKVIYELNNGMLIRRIKRARSQSGKRK